MISIIIPVYNCSKFLGECIGSILDQSFKDFEVILIDDCSTDNSFELCQELAKKDDRIVVLKNKKNSGTSKARNVGLNAARGELVAFVDDDDIIHKDYLKKLYEKQQLYDADIVQCRFEKFSDKPRVCDKDLKGKDVIHSNMEALRTLYEDHGVQTCVVFNKLYKKSVFDTVRYDDGKVHEDCFIIHKILYKSDKIVFIDDVLYFYRKSGESITTKRYNKSRLDEMEAAEQRAYFFKKIDYNLYILALIQLADEQINQYYNMKVFYPEDKDERYLIRSNFKRYWKIIKRHKDLMSLKSKHDTHCFKFFPRIFYVLEYKRRLNFFTQS